MEKLRHQRLSNLSKITQLKGDPLDSKKGNRPGLEQRESDSRTYPVELTTASYILRLTENRHYYLKLVNVSRLKTSSYKLREIKILVITMNSLLTVLSKNVPALHFLSPLSPVGLPSGPLSSPWAATGTVSMVKGQAPKPLSLKSCQKADRATGEKRLALWGLSGSISGADSASEKHVGRRLALVTIQTKQKQKPLVCHVI